MGTNHRATTIISFDPGGRTGWALFKVHPRAFTDESERILRNIQAYQYGEFGGPENEQIRDALDLIKKEFPLFLEPRPSSEKHNIHVVTERFDHIGTIGGDEVLSPVRINAALDFSLWRMNIPLSYQPRSLRIGVTRDRLTRWKLGPVKGKDAFAAVQHAVVFMRRLKRGDV
ncbi:MAG: hypothetical protein ACREQA_19630 [Candidatus Binatia bacterium]